MFRFAFGKLGSLFEFQAAFFTVAPKQSEHRVRMRSKVGQRLVDRRGQRRKFLEVLIVGRPLLRLLPQIFNRIVIRRGSCWIPGSWMCRWRTTRLLSCSHP
jgi:hypothetical protein